MAGGGSMASFSALLGIRKPEPGVVQVRMTVCGYFVVSVRTSNVFFYMDTASTAMIIGMPRCFDRSTTTSDFICFVLSTSKYKYKYMFWCFLCNARQTYVCCT